MPLKQGTTLLMEPRQLTGMQQLMHQVSIMSQRLNRDELQIRGIMNQMVDAIRILIEKSGGKFAKELKLATNTDLQEEAIRLIASNLAAQCGAQFQEILESRYENGEHMEEVEETLEIYESFVRDILSGRVKLEEIVDDRLSREWIEQELLAQMENHRFRKHIETMIRTEQAFFRPVTVDDIKAIAALYREFLHDGESLLRLANGESVRQTFLKQPEAHEIPDMERLLLVTKDLSQRTLRKDRRQKETMRGTVLCSKLDQRQILAVYLETNSPMDPEEDKEYLEENKRLVEEGNTGGTMRYTDMDKKGHSRTKEWLEKTWLRKGGKSKKIFLVAAKHPGLGRPTQAEGFSTDHEAIPGTRVTTYSLNGIHIYLNGRKIRRKPGKNTKLIRMEEDLGMEVIGHVSDYNANAPLDEFDMTEEGGNLKVAGKAEFLYLKGDNDEMKKIAAEVHDV